MVLHLAVIGTLSNDATRVAPNRNTGKPTNIGSRIPAFNLPNLSPPNLHHRDVYS